LWTLYNNVSNYTDFNHQLNTFAAVQEYLMMFINNLTIGEIDSIILQGSTLSQLTATTNQVTRVALVSSLHLCAIHLDWICIDNCINKMFTIISSFVKLFSNDFV
jgi:hypothetical protein